MSYIEYRDRGYATFDIPELNMTLPYQRFEDERGKVAAVAMFLHDRGGSAMYEDIIDRLGGDGHQGLIAAVSVMGRTGQVVKTGPTVHDSYVLNIAPNPNKPPPADSERQDTTDTPALSERVNRDSRKDEK